MKVLKKTYRLLSKSLREIKSKKVRAGFTLAEVLITLGIIGVVAAMTIPTLMTNINAARYRTQFKKAVSTLSQGVRSAMAQYDVDFAALTDDCVAGALNKSLDEERSMCALFNSVLRGSWVNSETDTYSDVLYDYQYLSGNNAIQFKASPGFVFSLNDGSAISISYQEKECTQSDPCYGIIDVNGPNSLPNKLVQCVNADDTENLYNEVYIPPTSSDEAGVYTYTFGGNSPCTVDNKSIGDLFPIYFYDGAVVPATNAAQYILNTSK